jgi:hypothetical protein
MSLRLGVGLCLCGLSSLLLHMGGLVLSQERLLGHLTSTRPHLETQPSDDQTWRDARGAARGWLLLTATAVTVATRTATVRPRTLAARLLVPASAVVAAGAALLWSTTASTPGGITGVVGARRLLGVVLSIGGRPGATRRRGEER